MRTSRTTTRPTPTSPVPSISIVKSINGDDANEAPGVKVEAGSTMKITYLVTNTGNVTLNNVTVTDDKIAASGTLPARRRPLALVSR